MGQQLSSGAGDQHRDADLRSHEPEPDRSSTSTRSTQSYVSASDSLFSIGDDTAAANRDTPSRRPQIRDGPPPSRVIPASISWPGLSRFFPTGVISPGLSEFARFMRFRGDRDDTLPVVNPNRGRQAPHGEDPPQPPRLCVFLYDRKCFWLPLFLAYILIGMFLYVIAQRKSGGTHFHGGKATYTDAGYFNVATLTTIGYGDVYPEHTVAKICVCIYIVLGLPIFAIVTVILSRAWEDLENLCIAALLRRYFPSRYVARRGRYVKLKILLTLLLSILVTAIIVIKSNVYVAITSVTTVGYGDQAFEKNRSYASFLLFPGVLIFGRFLNLLGDHFGSPRVSRP